MHLLLPKVLPLEEYGTVFAPVTASLAASGASICASMKSSKALGDNATLQLQKIYNQA